MIPSFQLVKMVIIAKLTIKLANIYNMDEEV